MPPPKKKPLTSAERSRNYRDRQKKLAEEAAAAALVERDAAAASDTDTTVTDPPAPPAPPIRLRESVQTSIDHMKWLKPTDYAARDAALMYAGMIDDLFAEDPTATGKLASLGQFLIRALRELGGTPTVRLAHELRSLRVLNNGAGAGAEDPDGSTDQEEAGGEGSKPSAGGATVTPIRPPKRKRA